MSNGKYGGFENKIFIKPVNHDFICAICSCKYTFLIYTIHIPIITSSNSQKPKGMYSMWMSLL